MSTTPDFANLTYFELLYLLISLPGMGLWAKVASDAIRNMVEGGPKLSPLGHQIGAWLRARTPLQMQMLIIGLIAALPVIAYVILAVWLDAALREIEAVYDFLKWMLVAQIAAAAYYQFVKARDITPSPVVIKDSSVGEVSFGDTSNAAPLLDGSAAAPPRQGALLTGEIVRLSDDETQRIASLLLGELRKEFTLVPKG